MADPKKRTYAKVVKFVEWALILVSLVVILYGVITGFTSYDGMAIDLMLYWAYALVAISLLAIVILGIGASAVRSRKSAITLAGVLVGAAVIIAIAYVLAPGSEAMGLVGEQPEHNVLKLTDTILNLTYFACGAAILAILASAIVNAIRK